MACPGMRDNGHLNLIILVLQDLPIVVESDFLLLSLNEHLSRTALVVQPIVIPALADIGEFQNEHT